MKENIHVLTQQRGASHIKIPLIREVLRTDAREVPELPESGGNINAPNENGMPAPAGAAIGIPVEIRPRLIEDGANPDLKIFTESMAFIENSYMGNLATVCNLPCNYNTEHVKGVPT